MYSEPRLAEHLDLNSLQSLTETYEAVFKVWNPRDNGRTFCIQKAVHLTAPGLSRWFQGLGSAQTLAAAMLWIAEVKLLHYA